MAMSRSGNLLLNPKATEMQEELFSDSDDHKMAFDDDRSVPMYRLTRWGHPAVRHGFVQLYTGGPARVDRDAWWRAVKAPAIFKAALASVTEAAGSGWWSNRRTGGLALLGGVLFALISLFTAVGGDDPQASKPAPTPAAAPAAAGAQPGTPLPPPLEGDGPVAAPENPPAPEAP